MLSLVIISLSTIVIDLSCLQVWYVYQICSYIFILPGREPTVICENPVLGLINLFLNSKYKQAHSRAAADRSRHKRYDVIHVFIFPT